MKVLVHEIDMFILGESCCFRLFDCLPLFLTSASAPAGFVITGADFSREIRLWRAHDFSLMQSIKFLPSSHSAQPKLITHFDSSTNLLVVSDVSRTVSTNFPDFPLQLCSLVVLCGSLVKLIG